ERRLLAILDARRNRRAPARWLMATCLLAVLGVSATLAAVRLVAREVPGSVVSGLVVGPNDKPVEGAAVVVFVSRPSLRSSMEEPAPAKVLGRGLSDAQGRYRIEVSDDQVKAEDGLLLVATAPGFGFAARTLADLTGPVGEPSRLEAEQPVEMKLVDLEGSPVTGAEVHLRAAYPSSGGQGLNLDTLRTDALPVLAVKSLTDATGRFTLRGIAPGHSLSIQVRAAGFGRQWLQFQTKADVRAATLALGRAHIVEGRVTLGKGGPAAVGAYVRAQSMSEKQGMGQYMGEAEATIADDGRYRLEAAPGGSVRLEVYPSPEGADAYLLRGEHVVPGDSVSSHVDFALPRGVLVRGRVTEAGTGRPVAGAVVTHRAHQRNNPYFIKGAVAWFNGDEQKAVTAVDGSYRLGVMPGPGYLLVRGPTADYLHEELSAVELHGERIWPNTRHYPDALRKLDLKPDDGPVDLDLQLRRGATVRGHLVGMDGQPVRDAVLCSRWCLALSSMTINFGQRVMPTRGDRFELAGCASDSSAPVFFLDAKQQQGAVVELSGKQAGQDLEVKLQPCGSATVRLVDDQGKPLRPGLRSAHLEVVMTPGASFADLTPDVVNRQMQSPLMADAIMVGNLDHERFRDLKTDAEGRMTFPILIPGATYRVLVFNQLVKTQIEFTVKPGEARDLGDLVIHNVDQAG
ncbi:carboxypeptidase-like regulatory domain-containing protein, partial [Singulisphaera acidiphila]